MRPDGNDVKIKAFKKRNPHDYLVKSVTLLETGDKLDFEKTEEALIIKTKGIKSDFPLCFRIEIE